MRKGAKRDMTATTLEVPLGSAPYRIKEFIAGRSIVLERVADYWGKDIPVNVGQNNFDQLRYEYFRDDTVAREAFKADTSSTGLPSAAASNGRSAYDFPAVKDKRVIKEKFADAQLGPDAGLRAQSAPAAVLRRQVAPGLQLCISTWERRTGCSRTASTIATAATSMASPSSWPPACPRARNWKFSNRARQAAGRAVHDSRTRIRSAAIERPCATICVKPRAS